jgi:hypothetical protein
MKTITKNLDWFRAWYRRCANGWWLLKTLTDASFTESFVVEPDVRTEHDWCLHHKLGILDRDYGEWPSQESMYI